MFKKLTSFFKTPTPLEIVQRRLEEHRQALFLARLNEATAKSRVLYYTRAVENVEQLVKQYGGDS